MAGRRWFGGAAERARGLVGVLGCAGSWGAVGGTRSSVSSPQPRSPPPALQTPFFGVGMFFSQGCVEGGEVLFGVSAALGGTIPKVV